MYNKIDKELLDKISVLDSLNKENVIVYSRNYSETKNIISSMSNSRIYELPIISAFATKLRYKDILTLSNSHSVNYIVGDCYVSSLIYNSKKIMNIENLESKINKFNNHACVVIDTGVYPHIDFCLGKNRIIKFVDLINDKTEIYDDNGHGTFVSGIICANSIVSNYSGIDNLCNLIVIKALDKDGETTSIKILEAMQWVLDNKDTYNIKVVCMSFGSILKDKSDPLIYGAEVLWNNGITVVCAAGNNGPDKNTIMSPAASSKIIAVGSFTLVNNEYKVADFSSRGPAFDLYKPDIVAPGVDIISTGIFKDKEFYTKLSGTSVSAPMVAGVVSLLYKINPNYMPDQIKYMLTTSCLPITGDRNSEGFGRIDLSKLKLL